MLTLSRVALSGLLLVGSVGLFVACSDDPATTQTSVTKPVCPDTVSKAGMKCDTEGYSCGVGFTCGAGFAQQAKCTCTGGVYKCQTSDGKEVPDGITADQIQTQLCQSIPPSSEACPASVSAADGNSCKTSGKLCYYLGKVCPENPVPQQYDVCICRTGVGDASLGWLCETKTCAK
jgi:hypothetical protein